jgi:hypothetical protein
MSADEIFVLTLVIGSVIAIVAMAVQSRRAKTSSRAIEDDGSAEGTASPTVEAAPGRTTRDRRTR